MFRIKSSRLLEGCNILHKKEWINLGWREKHSIVPHPWSSKNDEGGGRGYHHHHYGFCVRVSTLARVGRFSLYRPHHISRYCATLPSDCSFSYHSPHIHSTISSLNPSTSTTRRQTPNHSHSYAPHVRRKQVMNYYVRSLINLVCFDL